MTTPPNLISAKEVLTKGTISGSLVIKDEQNGWEIQINMQDPKVQDFFKDVKAELQKKEKKYREKRPEIWEKKALEIISNKIEEHFGSYGTELDPKTIRITEKGVNKNQINEEHVNQRVDIDGTDRIIDRSNSQILDCNPLCCLMALALADNCPNENHDFYIASGMSEFSASESTNLKNEEPIKKVTTPDGNVIPLTIAHTAVFSGKNGAMIDPSSKEYMIKRINGFTPESDDLIGEYNVYQTTYKKMTVPVIVTFGESQDLIAKNPTGEYLTTPDGNFQRSDLYYQRILQFRAAFASDNLSISDKPTELMLEGYANNDASHFSTKNDTSVLILFNAGAYNSDKIIDKIEIGRLASLPKDYLTNSSNKTLERFFDDEEIAEAKDIFSNMRIIYSPESNPEHKDHITIQNRDHKHKLNAFVSSEVTRFISIGGRW